MSQPTLGISLIAHNEERCLHTALSSTLFADDVVVVDCQSDDRTAAIASGFAHVRLFSRPNNANLNVNKAFAIDQLNTDWIFYLDPDEVIPACLADQIRATIADTPHAACRVPRRNFFFGRWLKYGGQFPDLQLRLFRKGKAHFPLQHVHETLRVDGSIGRLQAFFEHFPYPTVSDYLRKMDFYTEFQADFWHRQRMSPSMFNLLRFLVLRPGHRFFRRYFLKRGFLDGWQGFLATLGDSFQIVVSFAKFLETTRQP